MSDFGAVKFRGRAESLIEDVGAHAQTESRAPHARSNDLSYKLRLDPC